MVRMSRLVGAPPVKGRAEEAAPPVREAPDRREKEHAHAKPLHVRSVEGEPTPVPHERPMPSLAPPMPSEERRVPSEAWKAPASKEDSQTLYQEILEFLGQIPSLVRDGRSLPWAAYEAITDRAIGHLELGPDLLWVANDVYPGNSNYLVRHLASVGILSLRLGIGLGYDRPRLRELGLAAFLSDVGMWKVPEALVRKVSALLPEELSQIQHHTRSGAELIRQWAPDALELMDPILQHHERENGRGYPQGLQGGAIHPDAKIIGLVDVYAALIQQRPYRPRYQLHEAVREIVRTKHDHFASNLIKALLAEVSFFPPPTLVRLNTGEIGRVVSVNRHQPLRPELEVLVDSRGNRLDPPKPLDLAEAPFVYVVGPLHERELPLSEAPQAS